MKDFLGFEIFHSGIFLVTISFTWGFFAYSKQFEVVILMLLMKQKMCPEWCLGFVGHPRLFWGGGGGAGIVTPPPVISNGPSLIKSGGQRSVFSFVFSYFQSC